MTEVMRDASGLESGKSYRFGQSRAGTWHYIPERITPWGGNPFIGRWLTRCGRNIRITGMRDDQPHVLLTCSTCYRHLPPHI